MSARKSERLMNLLITLLVSRGYVTKQRLREVIPDYKEAPSEDAFERMFDRDKDDLRALGVPIEVGPNRQRVTRAWCVVPRNATVLDAAESS